MTLSIVTVGIIVGLVFVGLLGGYVIAEQTYSPKNLMLNDPEATTQWMSTMMDTMMNDPGLRQQMMNQMMENPEMMEEMMNNNKTEMPEDNSSVSSKSIHMGMNMFMSNNLSIEPNTTVTWVTHDMETHNVYGIFKTDAGDEIAIMSGDIPRMKKWSYTFEESGVFEYACGYHESEGMEGKLVVSME